MPLSCNMVKKKDSHDKPNSKNAHEEVVAGTSEAHQEVGDENPTEHVEKPHQTVKIPKKRRKKGHHNPGQSPGQSGAHFCDKLDTLGGCIEIFKPSECSFDVDFCGNVPEGTQCFVGILTKKAEGQNSCFAKFELAKVLCADGVREHAVLPSEYSQFSPSCVDK